MSTETQFYPGQRVKCGEFDAVIQEHYFEGLWNIILPGGPACVSAHHLKSVEDAA